jgi:F-type H+-transporting ATPase subunit gamma
MASTRDLRRRIKSVTNTAKITKAMQMVASSKMRRAQQAALAGRPYAQLMVSILADLHGDLGDLSHPLLEKREIRKSGVLLVTSDKGLCGALNANLLREVARMDRENTVFICAGRKGAQFISRTKRKLAADFTYSDTPKFVEARAISKFIQEQFIQGEVDEVVVMYNRFYNTISQRPEAYRLLPLSDISRIRSGVGSEGEGVAEDRVDRDFLFEPDARQVLGAMLPHFVNYGIYQLLLDAKASEQSARMVAMKNATDNAKQLIKQLTLDYNKLRQANITSELLEITTAQMALG